MIGLVKICGLTDRAAVEAAVEAGADALGFVFAESLRRVTPRQARALSGDLPDGLRRVAVMQHPSAEEWRAVLEEFTPQVLQTDAADLETLAVPEAIECWPVLREGGALPATLPATFVYEGRRSGRGEAVDWGRAAGLGERGRMILAGGLDAGNVARAIRVARPWGVDVSSAVESAPGVKDPALIAEFIRAARSAGQVEDATERYRS